MHHTVQFHRNSRSGEYRARCSCGWWHIGTLIECQTLAASHDIEWTPISIEQPQVADADA